MNPSSLIVSAPETGSKVTRSPTSQRSRISPSGRTVPRTCKAISQSYPTRGSVASAGGRLAQPMEPGTPRRKIERDLPGLVDPDQLGRVHHTVVTAAGIKPVLGERDLRRPRIEDPVGRDG